MHTTIWQQWQKYSIGLLNHAFFHPLVPFAWQRLCTDSLAQNPLLLTPGITETTLKLNGVSARCFSPPNPSLDSLMVFFHGGGFTTGSSRSHRPLCQQLAKACGIRVYSIDYRLAPEHPFPAALDDCEAATHALMPQSDPNQAHVILAGDSAGGNLALATAKRLQKQSYQPSALLLLSPWADPTDAQLPWVFDPIINPLWGWVSAQAYRGDTSIHNPELAPLYADLHGLPPTLLQAGKEEFLLPQIQRLANALQNADVPLTFTVYDGLWHSGQIAANLNHNAARAIAQCGTFVANILATNVPVSHS